ncbi:hypothetical protein H0H93_015795 [Arthromyces matolae]|nr:hypothetical protein H0H93_015795 [Arthromyces matolae]
MDIQAMIPPALAAVQNYILNHDSKEASLLSDLLDPVPGALPPTEQNFGSLAQGPARRAEKSCANAFWDQVAQEMWESYQSIMAEREELTFEE